MSQSNSQGNASVVGPAAAAASGDVRFFPPLLDLTDRYTLPQKWRTWKQRWEAYSAISNLTAKPEEYQIGMLISCANDDTLTIVNALPYSNSGDRNKPSEVLKLLEEFCLAQENVMYERHTFYRRKQEEDESVESFITSIRTLARTCDFTENGVDFSEQMIRDRLVCGIKDDSVRQRLLAKNKPDLAACVKESRTTAATREQAQNMRITTRTNSLRVQEGETTPDTVLAMTPRSHCLCPRCCGLIQISSPSLRAGRSFALLLYHSSCLLCFSSLSLMLVCVPSGSGSRRSFASGRRVFVLRDMSLCTGLVDIPVVGVFLKDKIANQGSSFAANDVRKIRKHLKERIGAEQDDSMSTNTSCEETCEEDEQPEQENNAAVDDPYYRTRSGRISKPPDRFSN